MADCHCSDCRERRHRDYAVLPQIQEIEVASEVLDALAGDHTRARLDAVIRRMLTDAARAVEMELAPEALGHLIPVVRKLLTLAAPTARRTIGRRNMIDVEMARLFNIELEGLSPEDSELATARQAVRFARAAAQATVLAGRRLPARLAARRGALAAARRWAPGLLTPSPRPTPSRPTAEPARPNHTNSPGPRARVRRGQPLAPYC